MALLSRSPPPGGRPGCLPGLQAAATPRRRPVSAARKGSQRGCGGRGKAPGRARRARARQAADLVARRRRARRRRALPAQLAQAAAVRRGPVRHAPRRLGLRRQRVEARAPQPVEPHHHLGHVPPRHHAARPRVEAPEQPPGSPPAAENRLTVRPTNHGPFLVHEQRARL